MKDLEYSTVDKELLALVPELKTRYDKEAGWQKKVGGHPGQYDVICFVLKPILKKTLTSGEDTGSLKRIFDFFERMARSSDIQVVNLLWVGILEWLVGDRENVVAAWKYMGDETKKLTRRTAHVLRREQNVPDEQP